ncbi:mycothione reductase [Brevibacterium moorei]|uniref:mycothione reductase n=1 Tax=Brevibacterium moorei TaxID=2968457 RepID=UPI00211B7672|nr:mycothione reductase [Brevibacterium sp. 68QC2CO]MCQ9385602.1 mycothione reductase [Brevibacterium sp. 68QC2CO]
MAYEDRLTADQHFDIALIGSGSGNSLPGPEFADKTIVYIDRGVGPDRVFGGTCLNLGCVPSKMFVHTADVAATPAGAARLGLAETLDAVDWPAIRERVFGRIDPITAGGLDYRENHPDNANLTLLRGTARLAGSAAVGAPAASATAPFVLQVALNDGGSRTVSAEQVVLAAGSRPAVPDIPGLRAAGPLTSDTIMRIDELPESLLILGSGVIAVEMAHIFGSLGVEVTLVARSGRLLRQLDEDVSATATDALAHRFHVEPNLHTTRVERTGAGIRLVGERAGGEVVLQAAELLVATGRTPNADLLGAAEAGLDVRADGTVATDEYLRVTSGGSVVPGLWALGDVTDGNQLKHVANHQLRCVKHNMLHPDEPRSAFTMPVPLGVFTDPQIACVGLTEAQAQDRAGDTGLDVRVGLQYYKDIAYGWAMGDPAGFAKIVADEMGTILGAHIIGPEATTLIQPLIQAMSTGQRAQDVARTQYWIHPAMPELVENALLQLLD